MGKKMTAGRKKTTGRERLIKQVGNKSTMLIKAMLYDTLIKSFNFTIDDLEKLEADTDIAADRINNGEETFGDVVKRLYDFGVNLEVDL